MILIQNPQGTIEISEKYFESLIGEIASKCYGIAAFYSEDPDDVSDELLKDELLSQDIRVQCNENCLSIELHIIVSYGVNIKVVTKSIIHEIKYCVEKGTGLKVEKVVIFVDSVL